MRECSPGGRGGPARPAALTASLHGIWGGNADGGDRQGASWSLQLPGYFGGERVVYVSPIVTGFRPESLGIAHYEYGGYHFPLTVNH